GSSRGTGATWTGGIEKTRAAFFLLAVDGRSENGLFVGGTTGFDCCVAACGAGSYWSLINVISGGRISPAMITTAPKNAKNNPGWEFLRPPLKKPCAGVISWARGRLSAPPPACGFRR